MGVRHPLSPRRAPPAGAAVGAQPVPVRARAALRGALLRTLCTLGLLLPWACQASATQAAHAADPRIRSVESGLLPITATRTRLGRYANIRDRMRAYGVAGLSVAVIEGGRVAWAKGYGVADARVGSAVTTATLFQAASISKPLAALGALALVERGKLDLDADVNQYLLAWKVPANAFTASRPVTLRTLLDHSAGLADDGFDNYAPGQALPTLAQVLQQHASAIHVDFVPGSQHRYSNTGYVVLQQLMVDASGAPFDAYLHAQVLAPLGMAHSTFQPAPAAGRASGHYAGGAPVAGGYRVGPELAVAGLWTTPAELARYMIKVQQWYAGTTGGVITPALARQMLTPQIAYAGLGVVLSGRGTNTRFGHDGFNTGFEASMVGYVHGGKGAVVMANSGFAYMLIKEVLGSIARAYHWPDYASTNQWPPSASITQQEVVPLPRAVLSAAVGRYALDANTVIRIFARDQRLFLDWPGDGEAEIFHTPDGRLFCPQLTFSELGDPFLRYTPGAQGAITELLADDGQVVLRRT